MVSFMRAVLSAALILSALPAFAQTYPNRPIHLIVPYPAGGGTDFFARLVGQKMSELAGQPIVVENKPGAATNLGADFVAKAPPTAIPCCLATSRHMRPIPASTRSCPSIRPRI